MNKIKLAIFDLDGTAADTLENLAFCANSVTASYGLPPVEKDRFRYFVGDGSRVQMQRLLTHLGCYRGSEDDAFLEEVFGKYLEFLSVHCAEKVVVYPGMKETVKALKDMGIPSVIFSNKPHKQACKVVESVYPEGTFIKVLGQRDDMPRKPDPAGALLLAGEQHADPSQCIYIGDTNTDMLTGKAAGMLTVGVLWGFRDREELEKAGADIIISAPAEILSIPGISSSLPSSC